MLPLWKPIIRLKDLNNPVIFDILGYKYSQNFNDVLNKNYISDEHPFIIFYDDKEDCYYYLKARKAFKYGDPLKPKKKFDYEIVVEESLNGGLFKVTSYVDCSQIFKCNKDLLESLIDIDCDDFKNTNKLDVDLIKYILDGVLTCIMEVPPNISLMEVKMNKNGETYGESLYLSEQKINEIFEFSQNKQIDLDENVEKQLYFNKSEKNSNILNNKNRYWNGINFCKLFLNEYYPGLVDEFEQVQGIKGVTFKYTPPKLDNIYNNDDEQDDENENNSFWPFR